MVAAGSTRWLRAPVLSGLPALFCAVALVALPTLVRATIHGNVTGCEFTPYLPFVLVAAILLRWWLAGAVALASVAVLAGLFFSPVVHLACFVSGAGTFLASSAMIIAVALLARRIAASVRGIGAEGCTGDIVFSLEQGEVWASWYGQSAPVRLGSQQKVTRMMEDFLAQAEVARRLDRRS